MSYETDDLPEEEYWLQYRAWSATQESESPIEPLHQPPRDLSRVAVRTCPISGLESHR